jgi:Tfp pilus assembly protein PilN
MIQFNLLPDVKVEFMRAQRTKRLVIVIAIVTGAGVILITSLLYGIVNGFQRTHINNLTTEINEKSKQLQDTPDLSKILTVQNQLNNLTALHEVKPSVSRMKDYIAQVTPANISYAKIVINMTDNKITFTGAADSLRTVNQFTDTLKFTKYKVGDGEEKNAFSEVVLDGFGRDSKGASFEVSLLFDTAIFDNTQQVKLNVPNVITTRSVTEKPSAGLFQPLSDPNATQGTGE